MAGEGTGPVIPIKGSYQANPAFVEATRDLRQWSAGVKANIDVAKQSVSGFKETVEFASQAMKGFGAFALARDIAGIATGAYDAARGLAQFVLDAKAAGVAVEEDTITAVRQLNADLDILKKEAMGLGVALADPFIEHLDRASRHLAEWLKGIRMQLEHGAKSMEESVGQGARGAIGNVTLPSWMNKSPELDKGNFSTEDWEGDDKVGERLARERDEAERKAQKRAQDLRERAEHAERVGLQEQAQYEQSFAVGVQREQDEALRKQLKYQQDMIGLASTWQQKLDAVAIWENIELSQAGNHEDLKTRILEEGERRRAEIIKNQQQRELKDRITAHIKNLQAQAAALNAMQGLAQAAGIRSHGLQKGLAIGQAIIAFNLAKAKAIGEGGPLAGPALVAAVIGMMTPIIGALRSSSPDSGSLGGGFSAPSISIPSGGPVASPSQSPQAPVATAAGNKVEVALIFKGSLLTEEKISQGVMDAIEIASRDGRTSIVTRKD